MPKWKPRVPFRNAHGRLYRSVEVKIIIGEKVTKHHKSAPPGLGFTDLNIRDAADAMIEHLEKKFPGVEFREVQIAPNAFNYIAEEPKEAIEEIGGEK